MRQLNCGVEEGKETVKQPVLHGSPAGLRRAAAPCMTLLPCIFARILPHFHHADG